MALLNTRWTVGQRLKNKGTTDEGYFTNKKVAVCLPAWTSWFDDDDDDGDDDDDDDVDDDDDDDDGYDDDSDGFSG